MNEPLRVTRPSGLLLLLLLLALMAPATSWAAESEEVERLVARGIQEINHERPAEALKLLLQALQRSPDHEEAKYYAGVAAARLGEYGDAETYLLRLLDRDAGASAAYVELLRLYTATSQCRKAEDLFNRYTGSSQGRAATEEMEGLLAACVERPGERRLRLSLVAAGQYDSNVILESDNPPQPADRHADYGVLFKVRADGLLVRRDHLRVRGHYSLYQSLHRDLSDFDVHQQEVGPEVEVDLGDRVVVGAGYTFEYAFFGGEDYGRAHVVSTRLSLRETSNLSTDLRYELRDQTFWDTDLFRTNSLRTGERNSLGLRQRLLRGNLSAGLYYFYDRERTRASFWDWDGHRLGADLVAAVAPSLYLALSAEYERSWYQGTFPGFDEHRADRRHQYSMGLHYFLKKRIQVSLVDSFIDNQSNLGPFDYQRNVVGLSLTVGIL